MPRVLVGLVHRVIGGLRHASGSCCSARQKFATMQSRSLTFRSGVRALKQHRAGPEERLDIVRHVPDAIPNEMRHAGFSAEPGKGCFHLPANRTETRCKPLFFVPSMESIQRCREISTSDDYKGSAGSLRGDAIPSDAPTSDRAVFCVQSTKSSQKPFRGQRTAKRGRDTQIQPVWDSFLLLWPRRCGKSVRIMRQP